MRNPDYSGPLPPKFATGQAFKEAIKLNYNDNENTQTLSRAQGHNYWKECIGKEDVADFDGHIEIAEDLYYVRFNSITVFGHIVAGAALGIKAGLGP